MAMRTAIDHSESSKEEKFYLEEYKVISGVVFDIDKRVPQIFAVSMTAYVSLLTWIGKHALESTQPSLIHGYAVLMPNFLLLSAFHYLLAQRRDLVGYAAYVCVLERRLGAIGIQTAMSTQAESLRSDPSREGESHDPIPLFFWALFGLSSALYVLIVAKLPGPSDVHVASILVISVFMARYHMDWRAVMSKVYTKLRERWLSWEDERLEMAAGPGSQPDSLPYGLSSASRGSGPPSQQRSGKSGCAELLYSYVMIGAAIATTARFTAIASDGNLAPRLALEAAALSLLFISYLQIKLVASYDWRILTCDLLGCACLVLLLTAVGILGVGAPALDASLGFGSVVVMLLLQLISRNLANVADGGLLSDLIQVAAFAICLLGAVAYSTPTDSIVFGVILTVLIWFHHVMRESRVEDVGSRLLTEPTARRLV